MTILKNRNLLKIVFHIYLVMISHVASLPFSAKYFISRLYRVFWGILLLIGFSTQTYAATCTSTAAGGNWSAAGTWTGCGGGSPLAGDTVVINTSGVALVLVDVATTTVASVTVNAGATLVVAQTLNITSTAASFLTVGGTMTIGNSTTARTVSVSGNVTVTGTVQVNNPGSVTSHVFNIGGNVSNTGTFNMSNGNGRGNITFNKNGSQTVSGGGTYTFNLITLNMGTSNANILDMQSTMTVPSPFLTITNGTYRHSNTSNITPWTANPNIPANGGFWLNAAATVTANVSITFTGLFRISTGTMNIGNTNSTVLILNNAATTLFQMDGGVLNVTGGINSSVNTGAGTFTMSNGTITLMSLSAGTVYTFLLGNATTLNWSGGTIVAVIGNNTTDDVDIRSTTQNVTGGTLQLGSAATPAAGNAISLINSAGGSVNLWNFVLGANVAQSISFRSPANVLNDLTIQTNNTLDDSGGSAINIGGGNASGNWINNGAFTQGASTVTFTGTSATLVIGGTTATTFNNLTINKASNNLTINTTPTINGTLTLTSGDIVTGANRVILGTAATIATPSATSYIAGSLQKNYAAGANLSYSAGNDFPVGDATNFTPVNVSAGVTSTAGSLTVSTTAGDHPQVTTPIVSTGIDAANSENRYWTFNSSGLTLTTNITATFTFIGTIGADVDSTANTANFIVQRYDGTNWSSTTLGAAAATSTQASNITLSAGNNDFAIGDPISGLNPTLGPFNVFESSPFTPAGAIFGRIFTKIVGTAITLDVVAINATRTGVNTTFNTNPLTIALLDSRDNTGVLTAATNCRSTWNVVVTLATSPTWSSGRATFTIPAQANAMRDARVRITQGANVACSANRFAIRPTGFTSVTSNMTNNAASGTPTLKTGQNFTLTALTGLTGYDNGSGATLASPQLIPLIDQTKIIGSPTAGTIGGAFNAAASGTATGASFFYNEVGNFGLSANAIFDSAFTAVNSALDCTPDFSNTLVSGKYGCKFGSPAIAQTTGSSGFGRFIPDNFNVSLNSPALGTTCGTFTYVGQLFNYVTAPVATVTARSGTNNGLTNTTTQNYAGSYMKLTNAALTPATTAARYSRLDALGGGTTPALNVSGLPAAASDPAIGTFTNGVGTLTFSSGTGFLFTRSATTPSNPFNADIGLAVNVIDADGVIFASNPASFGAATSGGGIAFSSGNQMRYGRLKINNGYGSELLPLPVIINTQFWNGNGFVTNTADSCTSLASSNFTLSAGGGGTINTTIQSGTMTSGVGQITLTKPTGFTTQGSVRVNPAAAISSFLPLAPASGVETFGTYTGGDGVIYMREVY